MSSSVITYYQDAENQTVRRIQESLKQRNLVADVRHFNGETNSEESHSQLIAECEHKPVVMVGVRNKTTAEGSTDSRFRDEDLLIDIYVATSSHRHKDGAIGKSYPIIEAIEEATCGITGVKYEDTRVRERAATEGGSWDRIFDLPFFVVIQIPVTFPVRRTLDAQ